MFYSHTFLARKGPLGTVWCAAHLQHRLKKSHYIATDISSTVDRIMFPEVPIALRLSGHLLLGVVRIYSKKVDYLFKDCDGVMVGINKAFPFPKVNLPENANRAPFESITLPENFELDSLNLEEDLNIAGDQDYHLGNQEDITLPGQIPVEGDLYVTITFDEDVIMRDISQQPDDMAEDILPSYPHDTSVALQDPDSSNQREVFSGRNQTDIPEFEHQGDAAHDQDMPDVIPDIEQPRDAVHDQNFSNLRELLDSGTDLNEMRRALHESGTMRGYPSPSTEDISVPIERTFPSQQRPDRPSPASPVPPDLFESHTSFGHMSPEMQIRASPLVEVPELRERRRKVLYDVHPVLSNRYIRNMLDDPSGILRKRKFLPSSVLGVWKMNKMSRKEQMFFEPCRTGCCHALHNIFKEDIVSTNPSLSLVGTDVLEQRLHPLVPVPDIARSPARVPMVSQSPAQSPSRGPVVTQSTAQSPSHVPIVVESPAHVPEAAEPPASVPEFEHLRPSENIDFRGSMPSPPASIPLSNIPGDFTLDSPGRLGLGPETPADPIIGAELLGPGDPEASTGPFESGLETPRIFFEGIGVKKSYTSDTPQLIASTEAEDLSFLEADNNSPTDGFGGTHEVGKLSARTRAVAQYLKGQSPDVSPGESSGDLSLNSILEGKTRKLCARMFFETLVLKSYGFVDVQQEESFGDIKLTLAPILSKAQF